MKIIVDSDEYKCWHEVGHATVCMHVGGDVDFIEFLFNDPRGGMRARCVPTPGTEKTVACAGFAAEFFLLKNGYAEQSPDDERDINQIVFGNCTLDGLDFLGRDHATHTDGFSPEETQEFMNNAIGADGNGGVLPIFSLYILQMQAVVRELHDARRIEGRRVRELLRLGIPR